MVEWTNPMVFELLKNLGKLLQICDEVDVSTPNKYAY